MVEKVSQADSNNSGLPNVPAVAPTSDTPYIQPVIGKLGYDTKHPEIFGLGSSPDNGASFHVWASFGGIVLDKDNMDAIWINGVSDRVKSEVNSATAEIPAVKSAADEAVKKADSAIASSKVNSDAIVAQSEAISEAKSAMDSATAEIQQTASNAASDAAKIRADVAQVQNEVDTAKAANSASVEALKSDIDTAKQDLANVHDSLTKAQSAVEQNQKLINDSVAKISNDIAQDRKDIASAQQANADTAKQLDTYSKQVQDQGKTIKSIQDKQDGFTATLADVQGNVTQVSDKVDGLSASLKDTQNNVASIKAQADQLSATLTDHAKSIATLTASAKELSSTLENADGRLSKVEQTAQTNSSTLSDVQGDLSQVKQQADGLVTTLKDAQGSITQIQQKADGTLAQLKSAQGDIASLQTDVTGIKATLVSHEGDIHTLQADSKSLHDSMQDAQGDISTLKKTSTDVTSELKDHAGRISKAEQTASTLVNEFADQQGHLNRVEQTAQGTQQTVANQQGQINTIKTDVNGIHQTITGQGNQIANINVTLNGLNTKYEDVSGDLGNLKNSAMQNRGTVSAPDFNSLTAAGFYTITFPSTGKNYPTGSWGTLEVSGQITDNNGRLNQKYVCDNDGLTFYRQYNRNTNSWTNWKQIANQDDITSLSNRITMNSTQITQNQQAIALKADQATVNNLSGEVSQAQAQFTVQAGQISSKVSGIETSLANANSRLDGITSNGGGRNLLKGTQEFQGEWRNSSFWKVSEETYKGLTVRSFSASWWGFGQYYDADPNTTYTFSFYAKASEAGNIMDIFTLDSEDWSSPVVSSPVFANQTITTEWQRYSVTFTTKSGGKIMPSVCLTKNNITIYVAGYMLEEGIVAHTWSPSPEDTDAKIMTNSTAIDQTNKEISLKADQTEVDQVKQTATQNSSRLNVMANEISSKVTSTDVNNIVNGKGYATTSSVQSLIDQRAGTINESITKIDGKVNGIQIGGTNLIADTDQDAVIDDTANTSGQGWCFYTFNLTQQPKVGDQLTISAEGTLTGKGNLNQYYAILYNSTTSDARSNGVELTSGKRSSSVFTVKNLDGVGDTVLLIYAGDPSSTNGKKNVIHHLKLERGNKATDWSPAPEDTTTQIQSLTASIDGIQSAVKNKADSSTVTQLSNLVQSKVSSNDFNSKYTQLSNMIDARVSKGDLLGEINLQAGSTLIKNNKIYLDGESVVFGEKTKAFIPSAAIENLEADKITTGTLNGVEIRQLETGGRSIDIKNGNIAITSHDPYESRISFNNDGKNMKMFNALGDLEVVNQEFALFNFTPEDTHSLNPIPFFKVTNTGQIGSGGAQLNMDHAIFDGYEWWTSAAGVTFGRTWNGVDKSSDYADIYAKSFVPHSELSAKTRIKKLDRKEALDKIMQDDMYTYQFKEDVRDGVSKRYASFIIDNIHDVAQYTEPEEFLSANGKGRDDGTQLAYLIAAVQYQQEQIEELKKKLEEK